MPSGHRASGRHGFQPLGDIPAHETVIVGISEGRKRGVRRRVGQLVEIDDAQPGIADQQPTDRRADKARPARYQNRAVIFPIGPLDGFVHHAAHRRR
jgi:hypothetical protein